MYRLSKDQAVVETVDFFPPVLDDAQTNGGVLAAVPEREVSKALRALERAEVPAWVLGEFVKGKPGIEVV